MRSLYRKRIEGEKTAREGSEDKERHYRHVDEELEGVRELNNKKRIIKNEDRGREGRMITQIYLKNREKNII